MTKILQNNKNGAILYLRMVNIMKKSDIYDYCWDKILEDQEIMDVEGEDFYNKIVFNTFVELIDNLLSKYPYDLELSKQIKTLKKENDIETIYSLIKREYLYRYVRVNVKSVDFPKDLKRTMLIPLRTTILEMMVAILSTLDTMGYHLLSIYKDKISFLTPIDEGGSMNEEYSAVDNYTISILSLKTMKLWYDYGEDWLFDVSFSKLEYLDEYISLKVLKFRGRGIVEDNKEVLSDFLNHQENEFIEEYALNEYFDDTVEDINDRAISEYDSLVMAYMGLL